ncbi:hypothetical protein D3C72_1280000 [compost metagenome]
MAPRTIRFSSSPPAGPISCAHSLPLASKAMPSTLRWPNDHTCAATPPCEANGLSVGRLPSSLRRMILPRLPLMSCAGSNFCRSLELIHSLPSGPKARRWP